MTVETLITQHIDTWTSAVKTKSTSGRGSSKKLELYGMKKLRELILELAVRGKLVPQDPNDEPASVLLERIAAEKAQLVKEKKIKKPKLLPPLTSQDLPNLPQGWEWAYFPDIADYAPGKTPATKNATYWDETEKGVPWISIADLNDTGTVETSSKKVSEVACEQVFKKNPVRSGTMLMSFKLTVGKVSILDVDAYHNEAIISIFPYTGIQQNYLFKVLPSIANSGNKKNAIMGFTLNSESLALLTIPVPPTIEQHRIVAKVDELMTLCDQLEQQTEDSIEAHQLLVSTLLNTLTHSADADELMENWARISDHFDTLFTTEESIDQLKQTILQLAVMGKLVPQDPNDEPASVLLERIAEEKAQLIKEKKIKKQKALPPIADDEKPFDLPNGWEWCRFSDMSNEVATGPFGSMIHKRDYIEGGTPLINPSHMIDSKIIEDNSITVSDIKVSELSSYKLFENDIVMARRGEMGRCALVSKREEGWLCGTGSFVLKFNQSLSRQYILLMFRTSYVREYLGGKSIGTTMTNLNHGILNKMPLLLPPIAQQHRIVTKVEEMMVLCNQLKARLERSKTTQLHLTDAIVEQAI
ncbi:restriction endonuclease subunit S [Photobacterium leiognathi]|uniref:Restriction endonuclease subunit S n=1 Tax=Photobacterium leiognathi TaxID=553611 RepID=A0ABX5GKW1_PHOLE|nr:restriction endonuclease subunit S [Photobacterium leiognathi]KJF91709.1 hypothetical protein UB42_00020 [Photobacterium leiognathi]PSV86348.1 restriction endonuclease subunit S [Photobacterium leiognathi]